MSSACQAFSASAMTASTSPAAPLTDVSVARASIAAGTSKSPASRPSAVNASSARVRSPPGFSGSARSSAFSSRARWLIPRASATSGDPGCCAKNSPTDAIASSHRPRATSQRPRSTSAPPAMAVVFFSSEIRAGSVALTTSASSTVMKGSFGAAGRRE